MPDTLPPEIEFTADPAEADIDRLGDLLGETRPAGVPAWVQVPFAFLLRGADGAVEGGLSGYTQWTWAHVDLFVLPAGRRGRGLGTRLLKAAEDEARRRGCTDIHLNTFSWQAKPFYERLGYRQWGQLDGFPAGHSRHFMTKKL